MRGLRWFWPGRKTCRPHHASLSTGNSWISGDKSIYAGSAALQLSLWHHRLFASVLLAVAVAIHYGLNRRDGLASVYVFAASATVRAAWSAQIGRTWLSPLPRHDGISEEG